MTRDQANAVYDILVQECGASETYLSCSERGHFIQQQIEREVTEWRFCGNLGFGGKFWRIGGRLYVSCYRDDETPERLKMIEAANKRLAAL
jgi:hypothetical protein